jgi:peptidoglycan/xylan/chitin deacetylase (PgdA/CDA1 family)
VFPALQEHEFTATFFIITGRADANDPAYLTWDQIGEMAAAGLSMEAHTKNHPSLLDRDRDFLVYELLGSRESLAAHTGAEPRMLAYPAGRYDALTLQMTSELDFWLAVTTHPGAAHVTSNRLELSRLRVSYDMQVPGLAQLLRSAAHK